MALAQRSPSKIFIIGNRKYDDGDTDFEFDIGFGSSNPRIRIPNGQTGFQFGSVTSGAASTFLGLGVNLNSNTDAYLIWQTAGVQKGAIYGRSAGGLSFRGTDADELLSYTDAGGFTWGKAGGGAEHKVITGTGSTSSYVSGEIHFSNGHATLAVPAILSGTSATNVSALYISAASQNSNASYDMGFDVRQLGNTDFATKNTKAFVWTRIGNELLTITRAGAITAGSPLSADGSLEHTFQSGGTTQLFIKGYDSGSHSQLVFYQGATARYSLYTPGSSTDVRMYGYTAAKDVFTIKSDGGHIIGPDNFAGNHLIYSQTLLTADDAAGTSYGSSKAGLRIFNANASAAGKISEICFGGRFSSSKPFATISGVLSAGGGEQTGYLVFTMKASQSDALAPVESARIDETGLWTYANGIKFPSAGATASKLDFFASATHATTFQGSGAGSTASTSADVNVTRIGNIVSIYFPAKSNINCASSSLYIKSNTALPAWARPSVFQIGSGSGYISAGVAASGYITIGIDTAGEIDFYVNPSLLTTWPNASNNGWQNAFTYTYRV